MYLRFNLKSSLLQLLLVGFHVTFAQKVVRINCPDFEELNPALNSSTLVDWVYDDRNRIYYKFQIDDTQLEFFQISDSIYKYREKRDTMLIALGEYTFKPRKIDTSYVYPPGEYEQELRYYYGGNLYPSDYWCMETAYGQLCGLFRNGLKEGTWESCDRKGPELRYKADRLIHIFRPTEALVAQHFGWITEDTMLLCDIEPQASILDQEFLRFRSNSDGCPNKTQAVWSEGRLELTGFEPLTWELDGVYLIFSTSAQRFKFKITTLGQDMLSLHRVVPGG
jgi:hypothetical protein